MKNISFALGTGRCGTKFLYKVLEHERDVASSHERHPLSDTFHRYCKWYNLPVDHSGFLDLKRKGINEDLATKEISFEASAFLSLSVRELRDEFNAKFILLVRSPEKVINSYIKKGWYENPINLKDPDKIPSFQTNKEFHHFLGRTIPRGDEFYTWNSMTQVGKLAWFWNRLNKEVLNQFAAIDPASYRVIRLEDLNFAKYIEVGEFLGFKPAVSQALFNSLSEERPNAFKDVRSASSWNELERNEFAAHVKEMCNTLGYDPVVTLSDRPSHALQQELQKDRRGLLSSIKNLLK